MRTVCPPITKSAMQLVHKLFRHILMLDTFFCVLHLFNVCMGVIPPSTHKFITVLRAVASSKVVIFFTFQKAAVYV